MPRTAPPNHGPREPYPVRGETRENSASFHIGHRGGVEFLAGPVDDVRVYKRALESEGILALYDAGLAGKEP